MLIPQFSIRTLLILTAVAAVFSLCLAMAIRGEPWAVGAAAAGAALAMTLAVSAIVFFAVWLIANLLAAIWPSAPREPWRGEP